jgi:dolichol-phosphate mannosyltransferase
MLHQLRTFHSASRESRGFMSEPAVPTDMRVSIIVPVLNEADGIQQLREKLDRVRSILSEFAEIEFVFVDDGSTDGTLILLREVFPEGNQCRILSHGTNRGVGAAFRTGFQNATGSIVCTIDADCSYEPEGLKELIEAMGREGADIAVASPYHPAGSVQDVPAWRLLMSRACSALYRIMSPVPLYTYTSIFRAYRRRAIETIDFETDGFVSAAEILIHAAEQGYRIIEVPMVLRGRKVGVTKMKILRTIGTHLALVGTILLQRSGVRRPGMARKPASAGVTRSPGTIYQYLSEKE